MRNTLASNLLSKNKGVALITVVGVTFFMSLMTATLVATHSSNFALMLDSANQKQAYLAASSGLDFAKCRLSQDRRLGVMTQAKTTKSLGDLTVIESDDGKILTGKFLGSVPERGFEVKVENLLSSNAPDSSRGLPAHCIVLKVHGYCGTFQANTETVLVEAPLYDSAAISNGAMDMSGVGNWTVDSNDPLRNWVRSNEDIQTPKFLATKNDATVNGTMEFLKTGGCPLPGVAWSKKDITIGELKRDAHGNITNAIDGTNKDAAYSETKGQMAPHATLNYNAYDLKLKDLNKPTGTTNEVPPGTYVLHKTPVTYTVDTYEQQWHGRHYVTVLVKSEPKTDIVNDLTYTDPGGTVKHLLQDTPTRALPKDTGGIVWNGSHGSHVKDVVLPSNSEAKASDVINIANGFTDPAMTYDFNNGKFSASSVGPLHVAGNLDIHAEGTAPIPNFVFEKPPTSVTTEVGNYGFLYSKEKVDIRDTSDSHTQYSINLQGTVTGNGAVAATGDLQLGGSSEVSADANNKGLVLWSGRNITFDVVNDGKMAFKGLVYAKGDVDLRFTGPNTGHQQLSSLDLEGALVAQSGAIKMGDSKNVRMKYNKDYLKIFTTGLPENTARFAQVSFKVF
jgi:hypothetical protein